MLQRLGVIDIFAILIYTLYLKRPIPDGFHCLRGTEFERDIGAAFASHVPNEAYLFKGNMYILLHFTPGPGEDKGYIVNGPKEISLGNWPSLSAILPVQNIGVDVLESPQSINFELADCDDDEL